MSGVKHTPVELHAVFNGLYWDVAVGPHDYSQRVASCHANHVLGHGLEDAERHARLFAAAPDLREALEQLLGNAELARFHLTATEEGMLVGSALFDTIQQARAAIARARGEQGQSEKEVGNG